MGSFLKLHFKMKCKFLKDFARYCPSSIKKILFTSLNFQRITTNYVLYGVPIVRFFFLCFVFTTSQASNEPPHLNVSLYRAVASGGLGELEAPQFLAAQLTLSQPGGHIIPAQ